MSTPSLYATLTRILPLATSAAIFSCQVTQQHALGSFLAPPFPKSTLPAVMAAWITEFHKIAFFKTACFFFTAIPCVFNLISSTGMTRFLWVAGLAFTLGHTYSIGRAMKFIKLSEKEWRELSVNRAEYMIGEFLSMNKERLCIVDAPAFICILAAIVVETL